MALESAILSGSKRLDEVAAGSAVIRAAPPHDDAQAVGKLQQGLRDILKIQMPQTFKNGPDGPPDGQFGLETQRAVVDFQKLAFPNDSKQWDGRVGRLTIAEMDKRLPKKSAGPAPPVPPPGPPPASEPLRLDLLIAGTPPHQLNKSDLDTTFNTGALSARRQAALLAPLPIHPLAPRPFPPLPFVPLIQHTTLSLELYFAQEALPASKASAGGRRLIADFFSNTQAKREIPYNPGTPLSDLLGNNVVFSTNARIFEEDFTLRMRRVMLARQGSIDPNLLKTELEAVGGGPLRAPELPFFGIGSELGILGHFQESRVRLTGLVSLRGGQNFSASLQYEFFDHFGCDDSDLEGLPTHGTPGQIAMWLLSRDPKHGPGHKPFVVRIHVLRSVDG